MTSQSDQSEGEEHGLPQPEESIFSENNTSHRFHLHNMGRSCVMLAEVRLIGDLYVALTSESWD